MLLLVCYKRILSLGQTRGTHVHFKVYLKFDRHIVQNIAMKIANIRFIIQKPNAWQGWLKHFCKWHNIEIKAIHKSEAASVNIENVEMFLNKVPSLPVIWKNNFLPRSQRNG